MEMVQMGAGDLDRVSDFLWECWSEVYLGMATNGLEGIRAEHRQWLEEGAYLNSLAEGMLFYMYVQDGKDIGLLGFRAEPFGRLFIDKLYVLNAYRGRGLGREAMEYALRYGREHGCSTVYLHVNTLNGQAIGFYRRFGLREISSTRVTHAGTEYGLTVMEGKIQNPT